MGNAQVKVFHGKGGPAQRELYEAALREAGITFLVKSGTGIAEHPFTVGPMSEFKIYVDSDHIDRALALAERLQSQEQESLMTPDEDPRESSREARGLLVGSRRKGTARDRLLLRLIGGFCLVIAVYFLARFDVYGVIGLLPLILGSVCLAAAIKT